MLLTFFYRYDGCLNRNAYMNILCHLNILLMFKKKGWVRFGGRGAKREWEIPVIMSTIKRS